MHFLVGCFVHCSAMAFVCTWGHQQVLAGRRIVLHGDEDALRYLARMDLHEHLGVAYDTTRRQSEVGRFLPLRSIAGDDDVFATENMFGDILTDEASIGLDGLAALGVHGAGPSEDWELNAETRAAAAQGRCEAGCGCAIRSSLVSTLAAPDLMQ